MSLFRKQKMTPQETPYSLPDRYRENNEESVKDTLEYLGIPRELAIVFGSGAEALMQFDRYARDVDVVLHPDLHREVFEKRQLPNGSRLTVPPAVSHRDALKQQSIGRLVFTPSPGESALPAELFSRRHSVYTPEYGFALLAEGSILTPSGYRVLEPREALKEKELFMKYPNLIKDPLRRALYRYDIGLYQAYLAREATKK